MRIDTHRDVISKLPGVPVINQLKSSVISGRVFDGKFTVTAKDGRPAMLAVVDEQGKLLDLGEEVERAAWAVALTVYCTMLLEGGHMTVTTEKPEIQEALRSKGGGHE